MRAISLPSVLAIALGASAQIPVPMHAHGPNGSLLIGRNIEFFAALESSMHMVTAVEPEGVSLQEVKRFIRYSPRHDSTQWATHLAARLEQPVRPGAVYFPGEVRGVRLFAPQERTVYFWGGDTLDPMLMNSERDLRYVWRKDDTGERTLVMQELNDHYAPREVTNFHIRRSGCQAWQYDSVAVVHCKPDVPFEEKEPAFVFVLVNGETVHVWREAAYADMSPNTHHYLLASLTQGSESALIFTTGEMLVYHDHGWKLRAEETPEAELSMIKRE